MNSIYKVTLKIIPIIYCLHIFSLLTSTGGMETFTWTGIVLITFTFFYEYIENNKNILPKTPINKIAFVLFFILIISTITSSYLEKVGVSRFFYFSRSKSLLYLIYHIIILSNFVDYKKIIPKLKYIIPFVMIHGLVRAITGIDIFRGIYKFSLDFSFPKGVMGFFSNYLAFSNVFQIYLLIIISFFVFYKEEKKNFWTIASIILTFICLMLSGSRMVFLSFFIGLIAQSILTKKRIYIFFLIIALITPGFAIITSSTLSRRVNKMFSQKSDYKYGDSCRYHTWIAHFKIFKDNPIRGAGYGINERIHKKYISKKAPKRCQRFFHAHNMYLNVLSGAGIFGFIAFMMFWILVLKTSIEAYIYSKRNNDKFDIALSSGLFGALIAFLTAGLTECIFTHLMIIHTGMFMIALIVRIRQKNKYSQNNFYIKDTSRS